MRVTSKTLITPLGYRKHYALHRLIILRLYTFSLSGIVIREGAPGFTNDSLVSVTCKLLNY